MRKKSDPIVLKLIQSAQEGNLSLFVGSAISTFPPTNIPSGMRIRDSMSRLLAERDFEGKYKSADYFRAEFLSSMSLEGILEICDYKDSVYSFMKGLFDRAIPNPAHSFIASLIHQRLVHSVITTNYDEGIEKAFKRISGKTLLPIKQDTRISATGYPYFFKLHGSISDPREQIINTLSQESKGLPRWKAESLDSLLAHKDVLFIGYSGHDFDICPLLLNMPIKNVYWCTRGSLKSCVSYEASVVISKFKSAILNMDLRELFGTIASLVSLPYSVPPNPIRSDKKIDTLFKSCFSKEERHLWFIIMLNIIGLGKDARAQCEYLLKKRSLSPANLSRAKREYGVAMFNLGRYLDAGALQKEATGIARRNCDNPSFIASTIMDEAEAERCYGNFSKFVVLLCEAYKFIHEDIHAESVRAQYDGMLSLRIGQLFETLLTNFDIGDEQWIRRILVDCIRPALEDAERLFEADDNFFGKSHLKYRLGKIKEDRACFKDLSREYSRLGYVIGRINSLRELSKIELKDGDLKHALKHINATIELARRIYDPPGLAKGYEIQGNIMLEQKCQSKAKKAFAKSLFYYSKIQTNELIKDFIFQRIKAKAH